MHASCIVHKHSHSFHNRCSAKNKDMKLVSACTTASFHNRPSKKNHVNEASLLVPKGATSIARRSSALCFGHRYLHSFCNRLIVPKTWQYEVGQLVPKGAPSIARQSSALCFGHRYLHSFCNRLIVPKTWQYQVGQLVLKRTASWATRWSIAKFLL